MKCLNAQAFHSLSACSFLIYLFLMQSSCLVFFSIHIHGFSFDSRISIRDVRLCYSKTIYSWLFSFSTKFKALFGPSWTFDENQTISRRSSAQQSPSTPFNIVSLTFFECLLLIEHKLFEFFLVFLHQHSTVWFIEKLYPVNWQWPIGMRVYCS